MEEYVDIVHEVSRRQKTKTDVAISLPKLLFETFTFEGIKLCFVNNVCVESVNNKQLDGSSGECLQRIALPI